MFDIHVKKKSMKNTTSTYTMDLVEKYFNLRKKNDIFSYSSQSKQ